MGWSSSGASAPLRSGGAQTPPRLVLKPSRSGQRPAGHAAGAASQEREPGGESDPTWCRPTPEAPVPLCSHCEAGRSPQPQRAGLAEPRAPHRPPLWADGQELPAYPPFMPACLPGERITWGGGVPGNSPWGSGTAGPGGQGAVEGPEPQLLRAQEEDALGASPSRASQPGSQTRRWQMGVDP